MNTNFPAPSTIIASDRTQSYNRYSVDIDSAQLVHETGVKKQLRCKSFAVLRYLADRQGKIVSRDALLESVWSGSCVTDDSVTQCIREIRVALDDGNKRVLQTRARQGYILTADDDSFVTQYAALLPHRKFSSQENRYRTSILS